MEEEYPESLHQAQTWGAMARARRGSRGRFVLVFLFVHIFHVWRKLAFHSQPLRTGRENREWDRRTWTQMDQDLLLVSADLTYRSRRPANVELRPDVYFRIFTSHSFTSFVFFFSTALRRNVRSRAGRWQDVLWHLMHVAFYVSMYSHTD
jgi:hypothetical protein